MSVRMLIVAALWTLALVPFSGLSSAADAPESRRYAFLVGVNDYGIHKDDRLANLSFCVADMKSFQERLEEIGYKRVYCLTTESTLTDQPLKAQIEERLKRLLADSDMGPSDFVLVALSGHGLELGVGNASRAYFCPADGHSERVETLIPVMWFYEQLAESKAGMKLLVVDACRNPVTPRAGGVKPVLSSEALGFMKSLADTPPPRGIAALLSCQSGQFSHEVPELGHGVFMHYILEGLSGKADLTGDGWVSLAELFNYSSDQTEEYVDTKCPVRYSAQTPILRGDLPNCKLARHGNAQPPMMPSEIKLSFTVVEKSDGDEKPVEGATVKVLYRAADGAPEATLGTVRSGTDGDCTISLPGFWSAVQGDFLVSVTRGAQLERFTLDLRDADRSWRLPLSKLETTVPVVRPTPMPPRPVQTVLPEFTNSIGMKLKLIPAGEFLMGSPEDEEDRDDDEQQHRVRITQPYYLGTTEVTQGQWEQVMGSQPWSGEKYVKEGSDYAASYVSWDDAVEFCKKLSAKEGRTYRLPTEAEWEYACRAGATTVYSFGNSSDLSEYAWWGGLAGDGNCQDERYAHQVGQKRSNAWGLYDMHGNVWEWCRDWYADDYYANSPTDGPTGPATGSARVGRGGGWSDDPRGCRSAYRSWGTPVLRSGILGFRVAQVPAE